MDDETGTDAPQVSSLPELVFGLVAPIGVHLDDIQAALGEALAAVGYTHQTIHLSKYFSTHITDGKYSTEDLNELTGYELKIEQANLLRRETNHDDIVAAIGVAAIRDERKQFNLKYGVEKGKAAETPRNGHAYILRQLKRSEEIDLLRGVYNRNYIQVSASLDRESQLKALENRGKSERPEEDVDEISKWAADLISKDRNEAEEDHGQRFSETFQYGDLFVSARSYQLARDEINRFIQALFGNNHISPTRDEQGAYFAKGAALRSVDLSRQVGAAITLPTGELVSTGCNEVPAPGGGNYWHDHPEPARDIDQRYEANRVETSRVIYNFLQILEDADLLAKTAKESVADETFITNLRKARVSDLTEFGRMNHAEMSAIIEAARLGRSVQGCHIHVTTYPCHNCAKHIIASGISRVVFIEPYPKSMAYSSHPDALSHTPPHGEKVVLEHFCGIAPGRYRDIFEKGKRRDKDGTIKDWYEGRPQPRTKQYTAAHVFVEKTFLKIRFPSSGEE